MHLIEFIPGHACFFFLTSVIHSMSIASLLLFIKDPVCFCLISGAKVVRVLEQKQGRGLSGLAKKSPPMRVVFFGRALLLQDTHLFMLMKQNIAYCGSLDE